MRCPLVYLYWLAIFSLLSNCGVSGNEVTEWLKPDQTIEFGSKEVPHIGLLNRLHWTEKNERSTNKNYSLWEKADVYLLEWPGNITTFDPKYPVVTWGKGRAKYLEDPCALEHTGIEMKVYAYNYVYLTWGPYRLTRTYTTPLTVPRSILHSTTISRSSQDHTYKQNELNVIEVNDIAFAFDSLLLAYSDGVIRVSGLEMAWAEMSKLPKRQLRYSIPQGINGRIDKIIAQSCCVKTEFCQFGDMVVAYRENSMPNIIYISNDGGISFQKLKPRFPQIGGLRLVLSFPEFRRLIVFSGNDTLIGMNEINLSPKNAEQELSPIYLAIRGKLQGSRLGMETSFVIWDKCSVWYSPDIGLNITRSLFYIHKKIRGSGKSGHHVITSNYCQFGENSALAYGTAGTFSILDSKNVLFVGIDSKNNLSQLIGLKMDMSLLAKDKELSVTPMYDTASQQPKLMYPPKFLELPKTLKLGKSYKKRLGMRILPKNVYPSDFILSFYDENAQLTGARKKFSLKPCQTSSLRINNSISQKRKLYYATPWTHLNFSVGFSSKTRKMRQLQHEPRWISTYLSVLVLPESIDIMENDKQRYMMKYRVLIKSINPAAISKLFRLTFFTKQDLRCNYQPRVPVYIKVVEDEPSQELSSQSLSDDDMARSMYLKSVTAGETKYLDKGMDLGDGLGETMKVDTCPFSK